MRKTQKAVLASIMAATLTVSALGLAACSGKGGGASNAVAPFDVTFNVNGGAWDQAGTLHDNKTLTTDEYGRFTYDEFPTIAYRTDYTFGGWCVNTDGTGEIYNAFSTITSDLTLYAKWNAVTTPPTDDYTSYTITFDANGGTLTGAETMGTGKGGKLETLPAAPTREEHTFLGWYTATTDGEHVTTDTVFDGAATVYAHWAQNSVTPIDPDDNNPPDPGDDGDGDESADGRVPFALGLAYVVGQLGEATEFEWDKGFTMTEDPEYNNGEGQWKITLELKRGNIIKIRNGYDGFGHNVLKGDAATLAMFAEATPADPENNDHNIEVLADGTYSFYLHPTYLENSLVVTQGDEVPAEDPDDGRSHITANKAYIVGWFNGDTAFVGDRGFLMTEDAEYNSGEGQWKATVDLKAGDVLKIRRNGDWFGFTSLSGSAEAMSKFKDEDAGTDKDNHNIEVLEDGTYTFYFHPMYFSENIWVAIGDADDQVVPEPDAAGRVDCVNGRAYIIGKFEGDTELVTDKGILMRYDASGFFGNGEWTISVELKAGDIIRISYGNTSYGYDSIEGGDAKAKFNDGPNHDIEVLEDGTYTFYFKPTADFATKIWSAIA